MNATRRKKIQKAIDLMEEAKLILVEAQEEEQCCLDAMPDSFQDSEKGEQMQEYADTIAEAIAGFDDLIDPLSDIAEG